MSRHWLANVAITVGIIFSAAMLVSTGANAATCTVSGPSGAGNQNVVYTITPPADGSCYVAGSGNINAQESNDAFLDLALADGLSGLAKTGDGAFGSQFWQTEPVNGTTGGTFILSAAALASYSNLVVGLKSGTTWAAFLVTAGVEYTWSIIRAGQGKELSHASLYGAVAAVPVPAGLVLLGSGLAALGLLRRRRTATA